MITINTADAAGGNVSDTTQSYGVGKTAGGVKIGAYSIFADVANVTADGVKSDVISGTVDSPSGENRYRYHQNANMEMMTVAASGTTAPLPFTTAVFPLKTSRRFRIPRPSRLPMIPTRMVRPRLPLNISDYQPDKV